ncbi:MAG: DUF4384 domain-containing protein [Candidatus Azobacteroides sp.]|nr:DUF4384 domain-containing protein [Candidatus Azobacteroides sp.]
MKKPTLSTIRVQLFLLALFLLSGPARSQNIVLNVAGKVFVNGQPVKKGDNLKDNLKIAFGDRDAGLKVLSPTGVCVIRYKNGEEKNASELSELIKSDIRKNSAATSDTRAWTVNPGKKEQVKEVDMLCTTLNVTPDNVDEMFGQYITAYCVSEFETPCWQDIALFLQTKYGFNPPRFTGELMTEEQYQSIPLVPKVRSLTPLPPSVSLKKYCPVPGNQGRYGTCSGWASAYAARTISWAVKNNLTDVLDITNQSFSPSFVYTQVKDSNDVDCQSGTYLNRCVGVLKEKGAVFQTDLPLPFQCNPDITPFFQEAKAYVIKDYQRLTGYAGIQSEEDFDNIKKALADNKPVIGSIKCDRSFVNAWGSKVWSGAFNDPQECHAVCLTGYDDNFDNGDGTLGAVELMNSWGTVWGDGGFIRVKYQDLTKILNYAISLYDDVLPVPPPEPPKPLPVPPSPPDTLKRMEGSFTLLLGDGTSMPLEGDETAFRNLKLVTVEKMTYNILNAYPGGTMFRINFTSSQPAYVYVISTDSKRSPLAQLFPDPERNISALLDFKSEVSVSIPDDMQYIQLDETPGEDYLCVIYSKEELNMGAVKDSLQNNADKSFVKIVKETLADKIVDDDEVAFEKNVIAFKAASAKHTAVPVFIKIKHR